MKLLELDLYAYGPFSNLRIDFGKDSEGLHVIYGPNEAGKSSALRALHALFYGVPERTADDFIHDKQALRVGGRIRGDDGTELVVYRRKGRKNTLLASADGEPIDEALLSRVLAGVDETLFQTLFGIDHAALVRGGESLLLEHGREAEALFGSGLGSTAVHTLLESFENRSKALFSRQASKPEINQLLKELKEVQRRQREISLSAKQWNESRKAVNKVISELADVEQRIDQESKRRSYLERVRRTLPNLAKRKERLNSLAELGKVPQLPDNFSADCQDALDARSKAMEDYEKADTRIEGLKEPISKIEFSKDLIEKADEIDELRERLGSYRKANSDLPKLIARQADRKKTANENLKLVRADLDVENVSELRNAVRQRRHLTEQSSLQDTLSASLKSAKKELEKAKSDLDRNEADLAGLRDLVDPAGLEESVSRARALGEIDEDIRAEESRNDEEYRKAQTRLDTLGLWPGRLNDLQSAALPSLESIQIHIEEYKEYKDDRARALEDKESANKEIKRAEEVLRKLELAGDVPTEKELLELRSGRDNVWQLLRKKWLNGADVVNASEPFGGVEKLPDEFESYVAKADETADRLRREAQRVHEDADARARRETCQSIAQEIDSKLEDIAERDRMRAEAWAQLWMQSGISPRAPQEMVVWLSGVDQVRERVRELEERRGQLTTRVARRSEVLRELIESLVESGVKADDFKEDSLRPVLTAAERRLSTVESNNRSRQQLGDAIKKLKDQIASLERDVTEAKQNVEAWRAQWHKSLADLGIDKASSASEVLDYLDACDSTNKLVDEVAQLDERISAINSDNKQFGDAVEIMISDIATDLSDTDVAEAISKLASRLTDDRAAATRYQGLAEQLDTAKTELSEAKANIAASKQNLEELCRLAKCKNPDDLLVIGRKAADRNRLDEELKEIEAELLEGGDGLSIDELEKEVVDIDRDGIASQIQQTSERIENELQPEQRRLIERKADAERIFSDMAGEDDAAQLAVEGQQIMSELRSLAGEYVRVKIAGRILRDQIEQFRKKNRSPILANASRYFARLTHRAFSEINTTLDEADQPVLVAVRESGNRLRVEGMSTGTRDQLYLALRLATLEHYADSSEPLPLVVDDILIQFDDHRSLATLDTLSEFAKRTQVILFAHHLHVVEQARKLQVKASNIFIHELPSDMAESPAA